MKWIDFRDRVDTVIRLYQKGEGIDYLFTEMKKLEGVAKKEARKGWE